MTHPFYYNSKDFLLRCLNNIQSVDFTGRRDPEPEVAPKIAPLVRMEGASQIQPVILSAIDGSESLVTEPIAGELFEASWIPVVRVVTSALQSPPCAVSRS